MSDRAPFNPQRWTPDGVAEAAKAAEAPPKAKPAAAKKPANKKGK